MRVAFFEVVERAVHEVLAHLLPVAFVAQVIRRSGAVGGLHRQPRPSPAGPWSSEPIIADVAAHRGERRSPRVGHARCSKIGFHSHCGSTPAKPAVVQLVADVQRQLQVEAVGVGVAGRRLDGGERPLRRPAGQQVGNRRRQRSDRRGQGGFDECRRQCHVANDSPDQHRANPLPVRQPAPRWSGRQPLGGRAEFERNCARHANLFGPTTGSLTGVLFRPDVLRGMF